MTDPQFDKKRAAEMFAAYPDVVDGLLAYLVKENEESPRVGTDLDDTIRKVFIYDGWRKCIEEIRSLFRSL